MSSCLTLVFLTSVMANRNHRKPFIIAILLATVGIPLNWSFLFAETFDIGPWHLAVDIVFFAMNAILILVAVFRDHLASLQAVFGAISAYLLLGLTGALGYALMEQLEHQPLRFVERQLDEGVMEGKETTAFSQLVYFSFVTMSTLGYGDIAPRTQMAQTVAWMQAVGGQLFIAVLIARLVSELPRSRP